ncbi:MAG: glycosyltransferase family A protein, partial [Chitinophagaceae bacterium]
MTGLTSLPGQLIKRPFTSEPCPPSVNLSVIVIIPARNEGHHISVSLDALRLQTDENGRMLEPGTYEVLLLANNCTDNTAIIVEEYQRRYPAF